MKEQITAGVSAIVLAAGSSTRMGTVKPLVRIAGRTMLERVLSTLAQTEVDEVVVVLGNSADLILATVDFGPAKTVFNPAYLEGMASSLRAGISATNPQTKAALIVLADQPFLKPETIDLLIQEHKTSHAQIVVPLHNGARGNPVLVDRSLFAEVAALSGDVGFRAIFDKHRNEISKVETGDPGVLVDLDTAADIQKYENWI